MKCPMNCAECQLKHHCIEHGGLIGNLSAVTKEAVEIFEGFRSFDVMEAFMDADVEVPRGEVFYDPIYEEFWG